MRFRRVGRRFTAAIAIWFSSLTMFGKVAVCVAASHLILLLVMGADHLSTPNSKPKRPLAVHIHHEPPPKPKQLSLPSAPKSKNIAANKLPPPAVKKSSPPKRSHQKSQSSYSETLRGISESFAALTPSSKQKASSEIKLPAYLENSPIEAHVDESSASSASYGSCLVGIFQQYLQLPEMGDVRARVTIEMPGRLFSLEILDSKSTKNAEWLKNQLPLLELPCFNDFSISNTRLEFTVTFRNVEKI